MSDKFDAALRGASGRGSAGSISAATLEVVRQAARRGDIGLVHELLHPVGPARLLADERIHTALRELAGFRHSEHAGGDRVLGAAALRLRRGTARPRRRDASEARRGSSRRRSTQPVPQTTRSYASWRGRRVNRRARSLALDALRSEIGEGVVVRLVLGEDLEAVRAQLGLRAGEPTAAVPDADDTHALMRAFIHVYRRTEDYKDAGIRFDQELIVRLAACADRASGPDGG